MNLHEECLIKYLINPLDLFYTTELLKQNNNLIEQGNFIDINNKNIKEDILELHNTIYKWYEEVKNLKK